MKKLLILTTALSSVTLAANAAEVTVMSWGGAYTTSQVEAYHKPFTAQTGITVVSVDADNPATPIKAMVEAGNVTIDVADVEYADAIRLCDEGLLETIDPAMLAAGPRWHPRDRRLPAGRADRLRGGHRSCSRPSFAYDTYQVPRRQARRRSPISSTPRSSRASAGCARAPRPTSKWR